MPLFNEAEHIIDSKPKIKAKGKKKKAGVRKPLPETLEREEKVYDLDENQKLCPKDGTQLKHIREVTNEQLEFIPASVKVIKHFKYLNAVQVKSPLRDYLSYDYKNNRIVYKNHRLHLSKFMMTNGMMQVIQMWVDEIDRIEEVTGYR